ncbi:MAG: cyclic nucleotide-binding domain-containing protein [bacterium]
MDNKNGNTFLSKTTDSFWGNVFKKQYSTEDDIISTMRIIPLFHDMAVQELKEFRKIIHRRVFKENEPIFWEGEPGVGMYIVKAGSVGIYKITSDRGKKEIAVLNPGEFFGELALLDESPRSATCIAKENSEIIGLFRPDLFNIIAKKPRLGNKFLLQLAVVIGERLKGTNKEIYQLKAKLEQSDIIL